MLEKLTSQDFTPYLNENFSLHFDEAGLTLETKLVSVSDLGSLQSGPKRRAFSLIFLGPLDKVLEQRIYRLTNPKMGEFKIFLVPIGPSEGGMQYQAIFN